MLTSGGSIANVFCSSLKPVVLFSPAKLNLFLAVTGRRVDGFHDLVSVAAPLTWGDTLHAEPEAEFTLECDDPAVPGDESNLVLRAAHAFRAATGWSGGARFRLEKRVPPGAGLGGGSSNATTALRAMNQLAGGLLAPDALAAVAARLGSDCPLFLHDGPMIMRGRGERLEPLPAAAAARLRSRRVLLFKPAFGISTPWAYARLAALSDGLAKAGPAAQAWAAVDQSAGYLPAAKAEARLAAWLGDRRIPAEALLFNNMEQAVFAKYPALPVLRTQLRADFGLTTGMSGSGSACFAPLPENLVPECVDAISGAIRAAWGPDALVIETRLA
jgi:4-diphosphocytidyl-2-C-methyl-D-erythritol kinase